MGHVLNENSILHLSYMSNVQKQVITSILMNVESIKMQFLTYFYTLLWANKFLLNTIQCWIFFSIRGCLSESWKAHLLICEIQSSWCIFPSQICCSEGLKYLRVYLTMSLFQHAWGFFSFLFKFVMLPHWGSSTNGISQIWLQVREESRKT
jgi:hypothetical protein